MVGVSQIVACGVSTIPRTTSGGGGIGAANFAIEEFVYDGVINDFELTTPATRVLDVYIDNGTYPTQIPVGAAASVLVDAGLLFLGNIVTIKYLTA